MMMSKTVMVTVTMSVRMVLVVLMVLWDQSSRGSSALLTDNQVQLITDLLVQLVQLVTSGVLERLALVQLH
jgi:hypothetical protein